MAHPFLSDAWMEAAREVRAKYHDQVPEVTQVIRMNLVVTDVPTGAGTVRAYLDTSSGTLEMELGELDAADVTVTTDYATAAALFVERDPAAGMQAFMAGKVKVQGDMMKLMALQTAMPSDEVTAQVDAEIRAITASMS